jgi:ubiquinone/menaquinone biosynthesis C-methylase UbiE
MSGDSGITAHYGKGDLLARLRSALKDDGVDPERPSVADLAPHDQFHGRGLEATEELADALDVTAGDHLLDVGSGIGGPARYFAERFGCRVTGIDLTADFCAAASRLSELTGLSARVSFQQGDALAMPFADASFDGAYSMNVSMNIADKAALYREIHRVLKPGGWLVLSEIARDPAGGILAYPTPWARSEAASFLATPEETTAGLAAAGFAGISQRDTKAATLAFIERSRALVERGEKPPHRAIQLIHGADARAMAENVKRGYETAAIVPIEVTCRKAG